MGGGGRQGYTLNKMNWEGVRVDSLLWATDGLKHSKMMEISTTGLYPVP